MRDLFFVVRIGPELIYEKFAEKERKLKVNLKLKL